MIAFERKEKYDIQDLLTIMRLLRTPEGCPWDRAQTHQSVRNDLLEEAYEVADAIDRDDSTALCEELGDLLLQVTFHSQMAKENGEFDFDAVADGICKKLIYRHPHVFADAVADTPDEVLTNWDALKRVEKAQDTVTDTLRSVPRAFPALMRAQKVQKRAAKAGFDWDSADGAWDKLREESEELRAAVASRDAQAVAEELGDLLFSAVNVSRFLKVNAEQALNAATDKFIERFARVERIASSRGLDLSTSPMETLDAIWDEVKHQDS